MDFENTCSSYNYFNSYSFNTQIFVFRSLYSSLVSLYKTKVYLSSGTEQDPSISQSMVQGSHHLISGCPIVQSPGYPSRAYIRDHLEPTSGTISSQHLGPSRANIWDHLVPTSGTISSQHLIWGEWDMTMSNPWTWDITMSYPQTILHFVTPPLRHSTISGDQGRRIQAKP